jgi:hypothetical protein
MSAVPALNVGHAVFHCFQPPEPPGVGETIGDVAFDELEAGKSLHH